MHIALIASILEAYRSIGMYYIGSIVSLLIVK